MNDRPDIGTLADRLAATRIDLVDYIEHGIPEREWLPVSDRMLARGARHHVAAPLKSGKSLAMLAHSVDMAAAGATVVILDRENGADEYARRLRDVLEDRPASVRDAVRERLRYFAWTTLTLEDGQELPAALGPDVDLVILDSTRTFLSALHLDEDRSDDFARFATAIIEPLFRAGIATVQLDNAGHNDTGRARGTSSKGDLADVLYSLKTTAAFDRNRAGKVQLTRKHSRFGDVAQTFVMELGAGHYGTFAPADEPPSATANRFRPTVLMERVSRAIEETPGLSKRAIRDHVNGRAEIIDLALELLIAEHHVRVEQDGQARRHHSEKPYREADDTDRVPRVPTVSQPCPGHGVEDRVPVSPPIGDTDTGHGHRTHQRTQPCPTITADQLADAILNDPDLKAVEVGVDAAPENGGRP